MTRSQRIYHVLMELRKGGVFELFERDVEAPTAKAAIARVRDLFVKEGISSAAARIRKQARRLGVMSVERVA